MSHLGERITEYVFGELSTTEMAEAKTHVAQCGECKRAVEHFERTRSLLQAVPEMDPPRSAVLTFEKPRPVRSWRWLAPMATAAALVLIIALMAPIHVQWNDSALTIAFGKAPSSPAAAPDQHTVEAIEQLQSQIAGLASFSQEQQRLIYEWGSTVQKLTQERSAKVGD